MLILKAREIVSIKEYLAITQISNIRDNLTLYK